MLIRIALIAIAIVIGGWVFLVARPLQLESALVGVAGSIVHGQSFTAGALAQVDDLAHSVDVEKGRYSDLLRDVAIVRLHEAENAFVTGDRRKIQDASAAARSAIQRSLSSSPRDAFLWFALSWLNLIQQGDPRDTSAFLRLSYQTGPNEGWVSLRRNNVALITFALLDPDLKDKALSEFQEMANVYSFIPVVARLIAGTDPAFQEQLLLALSYAPDENKKLLAQMLPEMGVDAPVPGVASDVKPFDFKVP